MRRLFGVTSIASLGVALLAATAASAAGPPITFRDASTFSDSFSGPGFLCRDEVYTVTATGRALVHFTYFEDTGALYFHAREVGKVVAVPVDGDDRSDLYGELLG